MLASFDANGAGGSREAVRFDFPGYSWDGQDPKPLNP